MSDSIKPWLLYAFKKETRYHFNRLALTQSHFRCFEEESELFFMPGIEPQIIQPIA
jgi:hypothetical protein